MARIDMVIEKLMQRIEPMVCFQLGLGVQRLQGKQSSDMIVVLLRKEGSDRIGLIV